MFADLVPKPRTLARAALTVAFLGLMLVMTVVAWQGGRVDLSSVGQVFGALAAGLLGAVINPSGSKQATPAASGASRETDVFWAVQAVVGCAALLLTALALAVDGSGHANAPSAFVIVAAAFSALFLDTSGSTHSLADPSPDAPEPGGSGDAYGGSGSSGAGRAAGSGTGRLPRIPSQPAGSADDTSSPNP